MTDKKSKFGAGLVIGTVLGGLAALFLSPKSGKENRNLVMKKFAELKGQLDELEVETNVKEIFGDVSEESTKIYKKARKDLSKRLDGIKNKLEDFNQEKYLTMVDDVISDVKKEVKASAPKLSKLKDYLLDNWNRIAGQQEKDKKKAKK